MAWSESEPGAGEPIGILALSTELGAVADVAAQAQQQLAALHAQLDGVDWAGTAADAFRDRVGALPDHLCHLASSYQSAADGLITYAAAVQHIQSEFRSSRVQLTSAQGEHARQVQAERAFDRMPNQVSVNPYTATVARAQASVDRATATIAGLVEARRAADAKAAETLHVAQQQGLRNASPWSHFWSGVGDGIADVADGIGDGLERIGQTVSSVAQFYWQHPADLADQLLADLEMAASVSLITYGAPLIVAGVAVSTSGAGAAAGVPLAAAGAAVTAAGVAGFADGFRRAQDNYQHAVDNAPDRSTGTSGAAPSGAPRTIDFFPGSDDPNWGLTSAHLEKHLTGTGRFSLVRIDPGGNLSIWASYITDLASRPATSIRAGGIEDIIGTFPRTDGNGTFQLGIRVCANERGDFDLVTLLTKQ